MFALMHVWAHACVHMCTWCWGRGILCTGMSMEVPGQPQESVLLIRLCVSSRHGTQVARLAQAMTLPTVEVTPLTKEFQVLINLWREGRCFSLQAWNHTKEDWLIVKHRMDVIDFLSLHKGTMTKAEWLSLDLLWL